MFLPMTNKDLMRLVRTCFWDSMKDFISLAHRPPGGHGENITVAALKSAAENDDIKKSFLEETKGEGLKIIWFVRCYECKEDNDVEVILDNDNPGKPTVCPKCGETNIEIVLKGVIEA